MIRHGVDSSFKNRKPASRCIAQSRSPASGATQRNLRGAGSPRRRQTVARTRCTSVIAVAAGGLRAGRLRDWRTGTLPHTIPSEWTANSTAPGEAQPTNDLSSATRNDQLARTSPDAHSAFCEGCAAVDVERDNGPRRRHFRPKRVCSSGPRQHLARQSRQEVELA